LILPNVITEGIMRWSVAFLVVAGLCSASVPVSAQQADDAKDPAIAQGFAWLCPGCGHFYTGDTTRGVAIATVSIGAIASGIAVQFTRTTTTACSLSTVPRCQPTDGTSLTPILVGSAIGLAAYVYGLVDAGPSTRRMNARGDLGLGDFNVVPVLASDGAMGVQLSFRGFGFR
jgi:hypothetical protein